jgi:hypothetical protein
MDGVEELISWKHSFKRLAEENEMASKKKQALDNLLNSGRISQFTYDTFSNEINEAIKEIENQQKALLEKMNSKMDELESQAKTLEMLLANFEIQHVAGEVEEEVYQREMGILSVGIEAAKHELGAVKEAVSQLTGGMQTPSTEAAAEQNVEPQTAEKLPEPPVEPIEVKPSDSFQVQQETEQKVPENAEEHQSTETKDEEKQ